MAPRGVDAHCQLPREHVLRDLWSGASAGRIALEIEEGRIAALYITRSADKLAGFLPH